MPLFYCFNCGFGTSYSLNKPKVCLKCNQNFSQPTSLASNNPTPQVADPKTPIAPKPLQVSLSNEISDDEELPYISLKSFANVDKQRETKSFVFPRGSLDASQTPKPKRGRPSKK